MNSKIRSLLRSGAVIAAVVTIGTVFTEPAQAIAVNCFQGTVSGGPPTTPNPTIICSTSWTTTEALDGFFFEHASTLHLGFSPNGTLLATLPTYDTPVTAGTNVHYVAQVAADRWVYLKKTSTVWLYVFGLGELYPVADVDGQAARLIPRF